MSAQLSIVQYAAYKTAGRIVSNTLGVDGDTITVVSLQDPIMGVAQPNLTTVYSLNDLNNQVAYLNSQISNIGIVTTDAKANQSH